MNIFSLAASRAAAKAVSEELNKPRKGDGNTVHLPKLMLIIGIICTTVFLIPAVWVVFFEKDLIGLAFVGMSLLPSSLIIAYINQRIYYDSEGFTAKSFFGIKRRYSYSDIEYSLGEIPHDLDVVIDDDDFDDVEYVLELISEDIRLKVGKRKILIDHSAVGGLDFLAFAQKQYKLIRGGKPIPHKVKKTKCDAIFNGNVKNATATIVIDVVLLVIWLGLFLLIPLTNVPTKMENLKIETVTVQSYEKDEEYLYLDIDGFEDEIFLRGYTETFDDVNGLLAVLDSKEPIEIGYETVNDDGDVYYRIEYVKDKNGNVLTTPEDYHEFYQHDVKKFMLVFGAMAVLWIGYIIFSIYVGRNPHKFSKKFVHKFFKEGTIRL